MLHQRRTSSQTNGSDGGGLSLSMGDDNGGAAAAASGRGYGSSSGYGGAGGYGYTGYPPSPAASPLPQQQSARKLHDPADKYRKRAQSAQFTYQSWMMYVLLGGLWIVTMIYSKVRYNSLYAKYETLQQTDFHNKNRHQSADRDRVKKLEKDLREALKEASRHEGEKKGMEREMMSFKEQLERHEKEHHHESSLTEDQLALLDPEHQKFLQDKEKEFLKAYGALTAYIQEESRREVENWLGEGPYRVKFTVEYPEDRKLPPTAKKPVRAFVVELASLDTMPHSIHIFLEQVAAKLWDNTAFIINPGHVVQAAAVSGDGTVADRAKLNPFIDHRLKNVAFQEYNASFPHERWTMGFAGRPGGPDFYINTQNNTLPHGPGGQKHHELTDDADPCFGKVVEGIAVIKDMMKRPVKRNLFVRRITIRSAEIVAPVLQHDVHNPEDQPDLHHVHEADEDEVAQQKIPTRRNMADSDDEPEDLPEYINHDKGYVEE